jgi:hypothetical protein
MSNQLKGITLSATVVTIAVFMLLNAPWPSAQGENYRAPRLPGTDHPDLSGIWQALGTAHWDVEDHIAQPQAILEMGAIGAIPAGHGVVDGAIPYQAWATAKKIENFQQRMIVDPWNREIGDPEVKCFLPGVPRATYLPFPFQIVQSDNEITIAYEFSSSTRLIHMTNHQQPAIDSWMGWSNGRWEGDSLVVDVNGFNGRTWFDRAGNFHSEALHVVERYTPTTPYHLSYEVTLSDPNVFERPWTMSMPLYRRMDENVQVMDFRCLEFVEPLLLGSLSKPGAN